MQTVEGLGVTPYSQGKIHGLEVLGISSTEVAGRALRGAVYRLVILPEEIDAQHVIHSTTPITPPKRSSWNYPILKHVLLLWVAIYLVSVMAMP
jgi:hypothetical protein